MGRYYDPWPNADNHWSGYRPVPPSAPEIRMHPRLTRPEALGRAPSRRTVGERGNIGYLEAVRVDATFGRRNGSFETDRI